MEQRENGQYVGCGEVGWAGRVRNYSFRDSKFTSFGPENFQLNTHLCLAASDCEFPSSLFHLFIHSNQLSVEFNAHIYALHTVLNVHAHAHVAQG